MKINFLINSIFYVATTLLIMILQSCASEYDPTKNMLPPASNAKILIPLADPFILYDNNTYYAYGTSSSEGFQAYVSTDLKHWALAETPLGNHLVLKKGNQVYGESDFWAPEVYKKNGMYYMFYSANTRICVATSDSPLGPFIQSEVKPLISDEGCIDHHLFIDDDGTPYLFFVRFIEPDGITSGNNIWMTRMNDDLLSIRDMKSEWKHCISVSKPWENIMGRIIEGPFVLKHNGKYYLSYSANDYQSQSYGVGYATSTNLSNPDWEKSPSNPILKNPNNLVGTGHHSFFSDAEGNLCIVFHAHKSLSEIHPRHMYISYANFDSMGSLVVDSKYSKPMLITDDIK